MEDDEQRDSMVLGLCGSEVYGEYGKPMLFNIPDLRNGHDACSPGKRICKRL